MKFSQALIEWYQGVKRDLPWRHTQDPYRILVSEVMLQQTRASVVIPYYERFLAQYPTATALAAASESELLAMWSGLGYYSRARNLQRAARDIGDAFPTSHAGIRELPGVGDYTAAAIASFAFGLPHAVLDGNVVRVMARVTNDAGDIRSPLVRRRLQKAADERLDFNQPGLFNQAIMELGATLCTPRNPQCLLCPVSSLCEGRKAGRQDQLPVKLGKATPIDEEVTLLLIRRKDQYLFWLRPLDSVRLAGFHELPDVQQLPLAKRGKEIGEVKHSIVNHRYTITIFEATLATVPPGFLWLAPREALTKPISTIAKKALRLVSPRKHP